MKLKFLATKPELVDLRPNSPTREWMDHTGESYAYRCLPLNVANAHGWSFHLPYDFAVQWNGENTIEAITFKSENNLRPVVESIFGNGIITFHTHGVFQTESGWSLMASGPANMPKSGISPLTGIIETDWSPYSFTMNWKLTRPGEWVRFKKGDPYCSVFPIQRGILETVEPELLSMESDPELKEEHKNWGKSRDKFNADLKVPGSEAQQEKWQKSYYRGQRPDGSPGAEDHVIKLRLKEFKKNLSD